MYFGYIFTIERLIFCLGTFIVLTSHIAGSVPSDALSQRSTSNVALDDSREKRNAENGLSETEDLPTNKRYIPYEELQKRLRHFIGKRTDSTEGSSYIYPSNEKRMRYFVGKRENNDLSDDEANFEKRMRYFVGKRSRLRYFVGKREDQESEPTLEDDLEKRMRYFVGKRRYFIGKRRYFIGKRADDNSEDDQLDKRSRLRYFVGKRKGDSVPGDNYQKRMRYFVGKREPSIDNNEDVEKRMRYFVGKRDNSETPDIKEQFTQKRMRYFVG